MPIDTQDNGKAAFTAQPLTADETVNTLKGVIADKQDDLLEKINRALASRAQMRGELDDPPENDDQKGTKATPVNRAGPGRFAAADISSIEAARERNRKRANG